MKSGNGLETVTAPTFKPQRPLIQRVLSATFVTLVILAGLDTVFPDAKHCLTPTSWSSVSQSSGTHALLEPFDWSQIESKDYLDFHDCNEGFQCAKLRLPLDYFNGTYPNATVSIAIAKYAARVPVNDPRYGGPILLNPGGPGGAGALFAFLVASALQQVVDSSSHPSDALPEAKYYDVIGFDPRGIGMSEPLAKCMPSEPSAWSWELRENNEGILGSSDAVQGRLWSMTHAFGSSCSIASEDADGPDIKQYMSTASVARDMLEITEKHAEYVAEQRAHLAAQKTGKALGGHDTGYRPGESKLQYWGFSYGTFLGTTFASMFPDRVGRVVLDGVVSSYDYLDSLGNGSLSDSEKAMESFYTFCHEAGPSSCALATPDGSAVQVRVRVQKIIQSLYHAPLSISTPRGPEILTWSDVKTLIFSSLYTPRATFPFLSTLLAAVETGGTPFLDFLVDANPFPHIYSCPVNGTFPSYTNNPHRNVATTAILCGDGHDQTRLSLPAFSTHWHTMASSFPTAGAYWSMLKLRCAAWPIHASHSFRGPFGAPQTSHPLLFLANTADPVTPLRSANLMHPFFPGSALVVTDAQGHCSLATPSTCTLAHVQTYFQTGNLPPKNTLCVPENSPWSLNSTDPDSPFYDPELGGWDAVTLTQMREQHGQDRLARLSTLGADIRDIIVRTGVFGFESLFRSRMGRGLVGV
ncbi:hypothetical protein IAQ61_004261 [Plenodomus lingam]|uniref:Peptidase S33 tripeptidyl aminopeptidase-like C-terminal domain-containing protein n=1 Tax=Leptosphaeria maculans (strain JN3 / isolate v23.1.3 / race Av1-4-5-6-7-8) TaxID=985895 RepID=E4ZV09_LEPMJ|nr:hypothetical protein LEMA_P025870.1 [Plenodomus lingam JN3]KAH9873637.1 hypothetical protein IAQ61_004261 [Plenodomus lingam]CBX95435.1 hypothetical protein LEMA_P025870.1 [Plenodomus lingam JN3]